MQFEPDFEKFPMMKKRSLAIAVWQEEDFFVARCLQNNISSFGKTQDEAMKNIQEALDLYFEEIPTTEFPSIKSPTVELMYA